MSTRSIWIVVLVFVGVVGEEAFQHPSQTERDWLVFVLVFVFTFFYFSDRLDQIEKKIDDLKGTVKRDAK
jgi:hypothetical protein